MRYLGLDLGTKTLGVSLSDRLGLIASTYKTIRFNENDYESALKQLEEIISEFKVEKIVLGLPKNMNNSLGFASERSMNFKKMIEEKYNIEGVNKRSNKSMNELTKGSKFTYIDSNNKTKECDILCDLETKDKNYIVYTDNSKCDDGSTKLYAASYIFNEDDRVLNNIETEEEWKMIEAILSYLTKEN